MIDQSIEETESKTEYIENQMCRNKLHFKAIKEPSKESWEVTENKVKTFIAEQLGVPALALESAQWAGRHTSAQN